MEKLLAVGLVFFASFTFTLDTSAQSKNVTQTTQKTPVGTTEAAYEEFTNAAVQDDTNKISRMMINGRIFNIKAGTKVRIVDHGLMTHTIRILEGMHARETGIVATEHVE